MAEFPLWFNPEEYSEFITESKLLFEANIPLQKQKIENRKKITNFDRQTAIRRNNLRMELMRDAAQAKAKGIAMGLGEEFKARLSETFLNKLLEASTPIKAEKNRMRPEVDPADKERDRKRESRRQEKQEGLKNILIIKNKSLDRVEIIQKSDYDPKTHELIKGKTSKMDKGSVTVEDLKRYSSRSDFRNTKTSIRILGKIQQIAEKEQQDEQDHAQKTGQEPAGSAQAAPPPPPRPRVPADGKEITDINSTYPDWDHSKQQLMAVIPSLLNTLQSEEMPEEVQQMLSDSRTMGEALNRILKGFIKGFPDAENYKYELADKPFATSKDWSKLGIKKAKAKASFFAIKGKEKIGFNTKIGQQIRPLEAGEAGVVYNTVLQAIDPAKFSNVFGLMLKDLATELTTTFSKTPVVPVFDDKNKALAKIQKQTWEDETSSSRTTLFVNKCSKIVEELLNNQVEFKGSFLNECLSGMVEFDGKEGMANMLLTLNKDGSNTKVIPLNPKYLQALAKSKSTDIMFKFAPSQMPENSPFMEILQNIGKLNENASQGVRQFDDLIKQIQDPRMLLQMLGLQIQDCVFKEPVQYSDFFFEDSDGVNTITFDPGTSIEKEVTIPVSSNLTQAGDEQDVLERGADELFEAYILINDFLVEQIKQGSMDILDASIIMEQQFNILEKRNYRKEYDNYHSKPEQRANRSKRVLARRKLEKEGRVKKGDGKDVDHKDGNPQNNSDKNLRVLSKSKNRSMNEELGAGFEGTPELVNKLTADTPGAVNPHPECNSLPYPENKYVKNKIKKK